MLLVVHTPKSPNGRPQCPARPGEPERGIAEDCVSSIKHDQSRILKEAADLFECTAINAEEFGKGIEDDHADLHLLRRVAVESASTESAIIAGK